MRNILMVFAGSILLAACNTGEVSEPRNTNQDAQNAEEELAAIEQRRLQAFVDGDWATLDQLHAEDFELVNPQGAVWDKARYLGTQEEGLFRYLVFEPVGEIRASVNGGAGAVRYRSNLSVQIGETVLPPENYLHTDYYELRQGSWKVVFSQATLEQQAE